MKKIIEIKRRDIIENLSDVDGWDMETLINYAKGHQKEFWSGLTNEELLNELNNRGDLEANDYNPYGIDSDDDLVKII